MRSVRVRLWKNATSKNGPIPMKFTRAVSLITETSDFLEAPEQRAYDWCGFQVFLICSSATRQRCPTYRPEVESSRRDEMHTNCRGEDLLLKLVSPWGGCVVVYQHARGKYAEELHRQPQRPAPLPDQATQHSFILVKKETCRFL